MSDKKARVCLVSPSDSSAYKFKHTSVKRMPLGLAYIGAALLQAGHSVKVIDAGLDDLTVEQTVEAALASDPQFVGITCTSPIYNQAVAIIDAIKKIDPRVTVIIGGPHVSALPEAAMRASGADFVCIGEGEESIVEIVDCVMNGGDPKSIPSIAYNWQGQKGLTQSYRLRLHQPKIGTAKPIDLNKTPIPARELFDIQRYTDSARGVDGAQTQAMFSRGCVGKCAFCASGNTFVRWRDTENILDELESIDKGLGIKHVAITDDSYTVGKKRLLEISRGILERKINLKLYVQLRLDQVDEEVCDALYATGVRHVGPGIESGNEQVMKQIGKGPKESKDHIRKKMKILKKYDWNVRNSYVLGMPGETEEQMMETIEFAKELDATENAFSIIVPYPGSALWEIAKTQGKVDECMDFSKFLYYREIACNLSAVTDEKLLELYKYAYDYVGSGSYQLAEKEDQ